MRDLVRYPLLKDSFTHFRKKVLELGPQGVLLFFSFYIMQYLFIPLLWGILVFLDLLALE